MKTKYLFTEIAALAVCISCAVTAFAAPGNGKVAKNTAQAITKVPRAARGVNQRFNLPPATTARIRQAIDAGQLERTVNTEVLQHNTVPAPIVLGNTPREISFSLRQMVASTPLEKEVLIAQIEEEKFYAPELNAARALHNLIYEIKTLDEDAIEAIRTSVLKEIKNHSLQTYLLKDLTILDLYMFDLDLTEYFSLDKSVEISAFNYTLRHPHQQTLMMRRLLNNPLVDEEVKQPLRAFLSKSKIKPAEFPAFQEAIANVYSQYYERIAAVKESDVIQTQAQYYAKLIDRLGDFIASHNGRRPKWNTADPREYQLFDEIEWVQQNESRNQFDPLLSYYKALNMVWDSAAPVYLSQEETIALFDEFVKTTRRIYPRSLRDKPKPDEVLFPREEELWDNLSYWRVKDGSIFPKLSAIYTKYGI